MEEQELKRIEQSNSIVEVAVEMGLKLRANIGSCFRSEQHSEEDEPSLFFNVAKNTFFCRTCPDVGGGVVDFVCQYKNWESQEAIDWLVHRIEFDQQTRQMYYTKGKKKG